MRRLAMVATLLALFCGAAQAQNATSHDSSPHKVQFVSVDRDVKLEVLDWGGKGRPLIFLAGFGNTAHAYDEFAPRFTAKHHVYGITRRGFGNSSKPSPTRENYDPDRLGDDVLAIIDALKLRKPVLAGHSIAGEELSSIGSRHPDKVAGLIYLDAADWYAFFNPKSDVLQPYAATMLRDLTRLPAVNPTEARKLVAEMQENVPGLRRGLRWYKRALIGQPDLPPEQLNASQRLVQNAVVASVRKYDHVKTPILALFAIPKDCKPGCADSVQADFVASRNPGARIIRLPSADHFIYTSNAADVSREMDAFMGGLQ
jgi:non-heme chloroperoxidase